MRKTVLLIGLLGLLVSCAPPRENASTKIIRLFDTYKPELVSGSPAQIAVPHPQEWTFAPTATGESPFWEKGPGIGTLQVANNKLSGTTTSNFSIVAIHRDADPSDHDPFYALEVRMRVSGGKNLSFDFSSKEKLDFEKTLSYAAAFQWPKSPIIPDNEFHTYTLKSPMTTLSSQIAYVLINPTDAPGATFEIESVRLILRKDYLAGIGSGASWQGLSGVYQETLVSRSPESITWPTVVPGNAWLDLSLGTVEDASVTFTVSADNQLLLQRTVTRAHRWDRVAIDLSGLGSQPVSLKFTVNGDRPSALGFWGNPVIRTGRRDDSNKNVILIWADTLRRDHLSAYGYSRDTSPHLREMAKQGTLFQDCIGQASWTKVATPAMMTSMYPLSNGVHDFPDRLPSGATTLAEVFHANGYATLSFSSILFTGQFSNLHQGFEEVNEDSSLPDRDSSKTAREYLDRLLPWLDSHKNDPFFVFLHVTDPHDPYKPYSPYDRMWDVSVNQKQHDKQTDQARKFIADPLMKVFGMPTAAELKAASIDQTAYSAANQAWYDGSIRGMDEEVGRLLERLRELKLDRNTIVVFTGDHGEEFYEHGRSFHGQSVYGELTDVPLVLWGPGIPQDHKVPDTVETIDIMPTLLQLCKLDIPKEAEGASLVPLLENTSGVHWKPRPAFSEKAMTTDNGAPPPHSTESYSIISEGWKLIHNAHTLSGPPTDELFDEKKDPLNSMDVAAQHQDVVKKLSTEIEEWRKWTLSRKLKPDAQATSNMSPEELERMRSLGYIQ